MTRQQRIRKVRKAAHRKLTEAGFPRSKDGNRLGLKARRELL